MDKRRSWAVTISVILALDFVAVFLSVSAGPPVSTDEHPFTVSEVYEKAMLEDYVYVTGTVSKVLDDHVSEKGFLYQQFMLTDGEEEIKVFCSVKYGRAMIEKGYPIKFNGEFTRFYGTYEISGFCSEIAVL